MEMVATSTIYYTLWLVANGNTIDTIIGTPIVISTTTAIQTIAYDF